MTGILDWLFPKKCMFCGTISPTEACEDCCKGLPKLEDPLCMEQADHLDRVYALWAYDGRIPDGIAAFKFHGKAHLSRWFAQRLTEELGDLLRKEACDIVVAIPMHPKKLRRRGYNQAQLLAEDIATALALPFHGCLHKIKNSKTQHELKGKERRNAQKGSYACDPLHGEKVLLVDDICTTGETMKECARMLKEAGASQVIGLAIAKTLTYDPEKTLNLSGK